jgi:wobble nucleotide-excising tRNase
MIENIQIQKTASYGDAPENIAGLSTFNFIYGGNGTGKTTISRVIADEARFPNCKATWSGGIKLETMVYNRDFIDRNFGQSPDLKGIFTLGEKDKTTLDNITAAKSVLDGIFGQIKTFTETLQGDDGISGMKGQLAALENEFDEQCWVFKVKHDEKLQGAFAGVRGKKRDFKDRILSESKTNKAALKPLADLEKRAESVFGETPEKVALIPELVFDKLLTYESNPILKKKIIGKTDVDIAGMIQKLGNSDWVKEGRLFYAVNDGFCPFCQQKTPESLAKSLNEYFDEQFEKDTKAIQQLLTDYKTESQRLQQSIQMILNAPSKFLELEKLKAEKELLDSKIRINIQQIEKKQRESSQSVDLESLNNVLEAAEKIIKTANEATVKHNTMVSNLAQERRDLTCEVWRYLLDNEIKAQLSAYSSKKDGFTKGIGALAKKLSELETDKRKKQSEIRALEKNTTSIQPTIDAINLLLKSFGFRGFSLAKSEKPSHYKIVRADGSAAKETLSEGEASFITFLYFYHLLKGSETETGMTADRVVVFDDPVSSLDSDVLFIVSNLIKGVFEEVRNGVGHIKQVFVMTHNVYFHNEVTFNPRRTNGVMAEETFWVVKKLNDFSTIHKQTSNPIKTSYDLLWAEIRNPNKSNLTIQNTLRRILESYFKILGNVNPDDICGKFEGKEKLICKSLFSWVNVGSHFAHDDIFVSIDDGMIESYLTVFRNIFGRTGHIAHYKMMMGSAFVEPVAIPSPSTEITTTT